MIGEDYRHRHMYFLRSYTQLGKGEELGSVGDLVMHGIRKHPEMGRDMSEIDDSESQGRLSGVQSKFGRF